MSNKISDLIFSNQLMTREEVENRYLERELKEGAMVTRLAPSPTGFIHLGNLYGAFVNERLAHETEGVFYLRIEDTDSKRFVEGAVETIIDSLAYFGLNFDEGATIDGEKGNYGPYHQSQRKDVYNVFIKELLDKGLAYPCFLSEEEIEEIRRQQEENKVTPGIYGSYAKCRDWSYEEVKEALAQGKSYVIRLKSKGENKLEPKRILVQDGIRGEISMPENFQDVVICKADGLPTYHMAHVVDDYLMRTTHVIRGEEWLSSLPIHFELFNVLGFELPIYCHTAQLMKLDENGNKRKLSKRLDPELSLEYYKEEGFHKEAIAQYLMTLLNSNFEEWSNENPQKSYKEFQFSMDKMSKSGSLFDLNKLEDISKEVLLKESIEDLKEFVLSWAKEYDFERYKIVSEDEEKLKRILSIGREDNKPRKDFITAKQTLEFIEYFYDEYFNIEDDLPCEVSCEKGVEILDKYLETLDLLDDQSMWFDKIRDFSGKLGYAIKPKDYKKNPDEYLGHVGHVSTVIRLALVGRSQSPDLWEIQQILGEDRVVERIEKFKATLKK